ncbi:MAG: hypothetical protein ACRDTG_29255 [Pseudonocardiaceae bacterium]
MTTPRWRIQALAAWPYPTVPSGCPPRCSGPAGTTPCGVQVWPFLLDAEGPFTAELDAG